MNPRRPGAAPARGAALVFAMLLLLVLAVVGAAVIRYAARDRIDSARMVVQERALTCAEAGLQYARRLFGCNFIRTNSWNDYLSGARPGRYDPSLGDTLPTDPTKLPLELLGDGDGDGALDPGTYDADTKKPLFWVSIRDDDDEANMGQPDDRKHNNNFSVIVRSECLNPDFAAPVGGVIVEPVLEAVVTWVQGSSDYGTASSANNSTDASTRGNWTQQKLANCD